MTDIATDLRRAEKRAASTRFRIEHPKPGTPRKNTSSLRKMLTEQEAEVAELRVAVLRAKLEGRLKEADALKKKVATTA